MPVAEFPGRPQLGLRRRAALRAREQLRHARRSASALIDAAHGLGLMIVSRRGLQSLRAGRELSRAPMRRRFFRDDVATPWGPAHRLSAAARCAGFFAENALYWLLEYRFDGLRFDAVHAIADAGWLDEMAAEVRSERRAGATCPSGARERRQRGRATCAARFRCAVERRRPSRAARPADRRKRRLLRGLRRSARRAAGALPRAKASSIRASPRPSRRQAARRRRAPTCRRPPSCCSCRTTTRSATAPSANG